MRAKLAPLLLIVVLTCVHAPACGPSDPDAALQEQRARWDVLVLNWAQDADANLLVSTRVSGPPHSKLEQLTVRLALLGESGAEVGEHWQVFDLAEIPRGGPRDIDLRIPAGDRAVDGIAVDYLFDPTDAQRARMPELQ